MPDGVLTAVVIPDFTLGGQTARLGLHMAKARTRRAKQRRVTLDEFDRDLPGVLVAARKAGGVVVVDADGNTRFRLSIPHVALPESRR